MKEGYTRSVRIVLAVSLVVCFVLSHPSLAWSLPDLVMKEWDAPSSARGYGTKISISYNVRNSGTQGARAFEIAFYYGDASGTSGRTLLDKVSVSGIEAGKETGLQTATLTLPSNVTWGLRFLSYTLDPDNKVAESNTANNTAYRNLTITGLPDLQVSVLGLSPATQVGGGTLVAAYRIVNTGYSRVTLIFFTKFYYSDDDHLDANDVDLGHNIQVPSLNAGDSFPASGNGTLSLKVPASALMGTRYIIAHTDHNNLVVNEEIETNNTRSASFTVVSSKPELVMLNFSAATSVVGYRSLRTVTYNVANTGNAAAGPFEVALYYGPTTSTSDLTYITQIAISGLDVGVETGPRGIDILLPANILRGTRYLHYFVDYRDRVSEADETNNRNYRVITVTGLPNLQVSALSISPTKQVAGGEVIVNYIVANSNVEGTTQADISHTTRFYYSADATLSTSGDTQISMVTIPPLNAAQTFSGTLTINLPTNAALGMRYIGVYADFPSQVAESNEADNTKMIAIEVVSEMPDVAMASWDAPASIGGYKDKLDIQYKLENIGNADASGFTLTFYYSDEEQFSNLTKLGSVEISSITKGQSISGSLSAIMPANVLYGKRYLHYHIDSESKLDESKKNNNIGSRPISISGLPNLQVSKFEISPLSQIAGGDIHTLYRVANSGSSRINASHILRFYLASDAAISSGATSLLHVVIPPMLAGASHPATTNGSVVLRIPANTKLSSSFIGAVVDDHKQIDESDENDNIAALAVQIVEQMPDLEMTSWDVTPSGNLGAGDQLQIQCVVSNNGQKDVTDEFEITLYYGDTNASGDLNKLGEIAVKSLAAGTSSKLQLQVELPRSVLFGKRFIHYYIDSANKIAESSKSNNRGMREIEITARPDLEISSISLLPLQQIPGGWIDVTYRVSNKGRSRLPTTAALHLYDADNPFLSIKDNLLTRITLPAMLALAEYPDSGSATVTVRVPSNLTPETSRYIGGIIDSNNQIEESDETNNINAAIWRVVANMPDLTMHTVFIDPKTATGINDPIDISFRIQNLGGTDVKSAFDINFYYGDSSAIDELVLLGSHTVARLDANTIDSTEVIKLKMPPSALNGTRYIHYFIDAANNISEIDRANNRGYIAISITGLPNLKIAHLSVSPNNQAPGGRLNLSYRIQNSGVTRADLLKTDVLLSSENKISPNNIVLFSTTVAKIEAQEHVPASGNSSATLRIPLDFKPGAAYIGLSLDPENRIVESERSDNLQWQAIVVEQASADLEAISISVTPTSEKTGQSISISYKIANRGAVDAQAFRVGVYFANDAKLTISDALLSHFAINGLQRDTITGGNISVTVPPLKPGGKGYIGLIVDDTNAINESDKTNNTAITPFNALVDKDGDGFYSDVDCNDDDLRVYPGAPELCDGKDNNCDGLIDNHPDCICQITAPPRVCYSGASGCVAQANGSYICKSPCQTGTQSCTNGQWGKCVDEITPQSEICDGIDNDCDGLIDNNLTRTCYSAPSGCTAQANGSYLCNSPCRAGIQQCLNGQWEPCIGEITSQPEICDAIDNDCDGLIDNKPSSSAPLEQACSSSCGQGIEICINGIWQQCTAPLLCEIPPYEHVIDAGQPDDTPSEIPPDSDCYVAGCAEGQICKNGICISDPCRSIRCDEDQFCRDGLCVWSCDCISCPAGQKCIDGLCVTDPCDGVNCTDNQICEPSSGQCKPDPCQGISCPTQRVCHDGLCIDDPCKDIQCPPNQQCRDGQCFALHCEQRENYIGEHQTDTAPDTPDAAAPDTHDKTPDLIDASLMDYIDEIQADLDSEFQTEIIQDRLAADPSPSDLDHTTGCACHTSTSLSSWIAILFLLFLLTFRKHHFL